ncbi:MAG: hypothetical protein KME07_24755 [Pegethrix bostrychoides GSE-TBD4-15B]|uniref:Uncharacterized protein n=1 Tax=Pegethrix bostrychoides GSE-TBD4-15B TaxID=2839662 RepID=A0A951PGQ6_9CYAN|nr:hypothetical protein [Pegethrix bostrychoides GSE-TBD4-15B]
MTRFAIGLIGLGFAIVGATFIPAGLPRTRTLSCQRLEPQMINCQETGKLAGWTMRTNTLTRLKTIQLASKTVATVDSDFTVYQVQLLGRQGTIALNHSSPEAAADLAAKLEQFVATPTASSFRVQSGLRSWLHVLVGGLAVTGGLTVAIAALKSALRKRKVS